MKFDIYITHSAEAEAPKEKESDSLRILSPIGIQQAKMRARYFTENKVVFDLAFCSPTVRSTLTAQHILANCPNNVVLPKTIHSLSPNEHNAVSYVLKNVENVALETYKGTPQSEIIRTYAQKCAEAIIGEVYEAAPDWTEATLLIVGDGVLLNHIALWFCDTRTDQPNRCLEQILKPAGFLHASNMV